jgi:hypothetical protein
MRTRSRADVRLHDFTQSSQVAGCSFLSKSIKKNETKVDSMEFLYQYFAFAEVEDVTDLFLEYANTFIRYCQSAGSLVDPPLSEYSTKNCIPRDADVTNEPTASLKRKRKVRLSQVQLHLQSRKKKKVTRRILPRQNLASTYRLMMRRPHQSLWN